MALDGVWLFSLLIHVVQHDSVTSLRSTPNDLEENGIHSSENDEDFGNHENCILPFVAPSISMLFWNHCKKGTLQYSHVSY